MGIGSPSALVSTVRAPRHEQADRARWGPDAAPGPAPELDLPVAPKKSPTLATEGGYNPRRDVDGDAERRQFEFFFESNTRALMGLAYVMVADRQDAEDLVQEALIRVWDRWPVVSGYDDPAAWARRVLFNLAASRLRRRRIEHRQFSPPSSPASPPSADAVDLMRALQRLPFPQRKALVLHEVVGLTVEEVAREMLTSAGTVRSWLHRARVGTAARLTAAADDEWIAPKTTTNNPEAPHV